MTDRQNGRPIQIITVLIIPAALFFLGITLQIIVGYFPLGSIQFPVNVIIFAEILILLPLVWILFKKRRFVRWLSSPEAALSALTFFTFLVMIMAFIPQSGHPDRLGFTRVTDSMMFALSMLFLAVVLGLTTVRRLFPVSKRNVIFFLNHFGLWIVITAGSLGQADKREVTVICPSEQLVWYGSDHVNRRVELPFALELGEFILKGYPPKLALLDSTGKLLKIPGDQLKMVDQPGLFKIDSFRINVETFYTNAYVRPDTVLSVRGVRGTGPAARVVIDAPSGKTARGWIASQTVKSFPRVLNLSPDISLALLPPEPAYYGARVKLYTQSGIEGEERLIEVNQPVRAEGWKIYLQNYDASGESDVCTFSAVKDPWLPLVYSGLVMMCAGALGLIFISPGISRRKQT
jgi:hypothetical protein